MDTPTRLTLRIFVSSPGDVPVERDRAADVVARLQEEFVHYAVLEPFFWEDQPARATDTFQSQFPEASGMDIVVGILWARIGTPLPVDKVRTDGTRYESGTVYELETAAESYRSRGVPDLVVYRRTSNPPLRLDDEVERQRQREQLEALEAFIRQRFFHEDGSFKAAFHTFKTPDQFEQQLETHLRKLIREKVERDEQEDGEIVFHGVPYPGLKAFGLEDAPVFYGRARALAAVKEALQAQAGRGCAFLLIFGMSGSGKSSLVRAGLVHTLTATPGWIEGKDVWRWCLVRPGDATGDPLDALAQAFFGDTALPELRAGGLDAARLARTLRDNPDDMDVILGPVLRAVAVAERERRAADRPLEARLLVVVDQMEELFTRDWLEEPAQARYVTALAALARSGVAWVVTTMRSDFFARCAEVPELVDLKAGRGQLDLLPPTFAELGQMIRYPARDAALRWGKDPDHPGQALDDVLQEAAGRDPKALPLLQFTLNELFLRREGCTLALAAYHALGGLEGALANHAEKTLTALEPELQAELPGLLRTLATVGEDDEEPVVSRRVSRWAWATTPARAAVLDALVAARLLVADKSADGSPVVGLAHEALLKHWDRLRDWVTANRADLRTRQRISAAAERWTREGRRPDLLLPSGKPLDEAQALLRSWGEELSRTERDLITRSAARARLGRWLRRAAIAALVMLTAAAITLAIVASRARQDAEYKALAETEARNRAEREARIAIASRLAFQSSEARDKKPQLALLLAVEANRTLRESDPRVPAAEQALIDTYSIMGGRPLIGHEGAVNSVCFSPDSKRIVTASADGTARIWDADHPDAQPVVLRGQDSSVRSASFSPDGRWVVTAGSEGTAWIWDAVHPDSQPAALRGHEGSVLSASYSPDGKRIVTASQNGPARLWDIDHPDTPPVVLGGQKGWAHSVSFSADGKRVVACGINGRVWIWDPDHPANSPVILGIAEAPGWPALAVSFMPDRRRILTQSIIGTALLWDPDHPDSRPPQVGGHHAAVLGGHVFRVLSASFSLDGKRVVTTGPEGTALVWDADHPEARPVVLRGPEEYVNCASFSADGKRVVTGSTDGTARIWDADHPDIEQGVVLRGSKRFRSASFSPDGRRVVTVDSDGTAQIWDADQPDAPPVILRGQDSSVRSASFSPDGKRIVTASGVGPARVWDADHPESLSTVVLGGHHNWVGCASFSPNGKRVVTAGSDGMAQIWDLDRPTAPLAVLRGHVKEVVSVSYSPDGKRIVTASEDGMARIWDADHPDAPPLIFHVHELTVLSASFSPDGRWIVTACFDETARIWDADHPDAPPVVLYGHDNEVRSVSFSPDGKRIVTAGGDGPAKIWDADHPDTQPVVLRGHAEQALSASFRPDGRVIVTASVEGTARFWPVCVDDLIRLAGRTVGRNLTREEWTRYLPGKPYRPTFDHLLIQR
jgi:WD40 repeat protein